MQLHTRESAAMSVSYQSQRGYSTRQLFAPTFLHHPSKLSPLPVWKARDRRLAAVTQPSENNVIVWPSLMDILDSPALKGSECSSLVAVNLRTWGLLRFPETYTSSGGVPL